MKTQHNAQLNNAPGTARTSVQGFSLVELMVALVASSFIIAAAFSVFTSHYRTWIVENQVSDMQQSARTAMDFLAKEIRMAGFGAPDGAVNGFATAINAANNSASGTDAITVVTAYHQMSTLAAGAAKGDTTITLQSADDAAGFNTTTRCYLYLDGVSEDDHYQVTAAASAVLTITPALVRDYDAGSLVFLAKAITYGLDFTPSAHPCLRRDDNTGTGATLIATNIEDLQFAYQDSDGTWHDNPPDPEDILAVRISVLARSDREDPEWKRSVAGLRPAVEDHSAAAQGDGYRRRLMTTVVEVRNMGL